MECPVCRQCHPKQFDALLIWTRFLTCKKCGVVFRPLTKADNDFWSIVFDEDSQDDQSDSE